ncbi:MAG: glycine zipper 2TM domain-containing protein [Burkholderiales bacterium]|nr:glycine zipper 2TM domain-containing protein [Burkholderiales bacterium]
MNTSAKLFLSMLAIGALPMAQAADFEDYARVISVAPQVEQINRPRQECHTEYVQTERQVTVNNANTNNGRSNSGAIIGGVAGAILGNQIGNGNGRTAATAVGAIAGAITGDRIDNNGNTTNNNGPTYTTQVSEQPVRRCKTVDQWETRNNGYAVTYEFHGHTYTSVMPNDPGKRMRVRVSVVPEIN